MEEVIIRLDVIRALIQDVWSSAELYVFDSREIRVIIGSVLLISLVSTWTIYRRLGIQGWKCLIPIYRWVVLFRGIGINAWLAILMLIPGVNLIMRLVVYFYMARTFRRSYAIVLGLVLLPLIYVPVVAFGNGKCQHFRKARSIYVDDPLPRASTKQIAYSSKEQPSIVSQQFSDRRSIVIPVIDIVSQQTTQGRRTNFECPVSGASETVRITVHTKENGQELRVTPKMVKKKRYMDFVRKMHRPVAKPVSAVIRPDRLISSKAKQGQHTQRRVVTKYMPGDIRPMKNNIVRIGDLSIDPVPVPERPTPSTHQVISFYS